MLTKKLQDQKKLINQLIRSYLPCQESYEKVIYEAMEYSLFAGGKRLRPILMLVANKLVGGKQKEAYPFAVAIEMIHTYSLIHDDLPAMDNDEYRRGKLTNHKVFGDAIAILAGDALLNLSYEIMLNECMKNFDVLKVRAADVIARAAGVKGMVGGQVVDVISENINIDEQQLMYINKCKTAALIQASTMVGAVLGGGSDEEINALKNYGYYLGMAFQIQDDILDIISTTEMLGKSVKSDIKNGKTTYVSLHGLRRAKDEVKNISDQALNCLNIFTDKNSLLRQLTYYLIDRNY